MKATNIYLAAKTNIAQEASDYINGGGKEKKF